MGEPGIVSEGRRCGVAAVTSISNYSLHQCISDLQDESLARCGFDLNLTKSVWSVVGESVSFAVSVYTWKLQCGAVSVSSKKTTFQARRNPGQEVNIEAGEVTIFIHMPLVTS